MCRILTMRFTIGVFEETGLPPARAGPYRTEANNLPDPNPGGMASLCHGTAAEFQELIMILKQCELRTCQSEILKTTDQISDAEMPL
jgi:hypothetical protein